MTVDSGAQGWTAVVLTASSERQADAYRAGIQRRVESGRIASGTRYLVVPDPDGRPLGSGGATLHALAELARQAGASPDSWWAASRVLMIHSGGESRRLPQYAASGKLFGVLPARTPGESSTVFDEMLEAARDWAARIPSGLLVASGDVVLRFDAAEVDWRRQGITGIAMRQPAGRGAEHGVYVTDGEGLVYKFLQKPAPAEVEAAGGLLPDGQVALDTGLLFFDSRIAARLTELGRASQILPLDLYEHFTKALTGQWTGEGGLPARLSAALDGVRFSCSLVSGEFTHIGTTQHFRLAASAAGGVLDSVLGGTLARGADAVVLECHLEGDVKVGRGSVLHGLTGIRGAVELPEETVAHQLPVIARGGAQAAVIRVWGVEDDPKQHLSAGATWLGRPIETAIADLGLDCEAVWPGISLEHRTLWNAGLFPAGPPEDVWNCACWLLGYASAFDGDAWLRAERFSLESSARCADNSMLAEWRRLRAEAAWSRNAAALAASGTDIRPVLANPPSVAALAVAGHTLLARAGRLEAGIPGGFAAGPHPLSAAASHYTQASMLFARAGYDAEATEAQRRAFDCVALAVREGARPPRAKAYGIWRYDKVVVAAPPRIDFGGGWSDTPPFCIDWGGTVLNAALELNGVYPIATHLRRLDAPLVRCISEETGETAEFTTSEELAAAQRPGSPYAIPACALQLAGIAGSDEPLAEALRRLGGGLEFRLRVSLPIGSGLGTSSILGATVARALSQMAGCVPSQQELSDDVMRLEQHLTTGGGWQDQAGGIFPGVKLLSTGPGVRQRLRVQPVVWSAERKAEFSSRLVLCYTGIRRMARNLLQQVVRSYLAREVSTVQVLHSIKTLASEMAYAMAEGEWKYLGELLDRHWELNKVLDPNTANAPINAMLGELRPLLHGAKLAGAGGGGFLILLASSPEAAAELRLRLGAGVYSFRIAEEGLRVNCR